VCSSYHRGSGASKPPFAEVLHFDIKARTKTKPIKQWNVGREFNRRLKKRFDEQNIEIPFPHMTLYLGQDKAGHAPPLNVAMADSARDARKTRPTETEPD